jgi:hypothetical protein
MPKAATDNVVCIACGADVRSEALFCYNCGGAIAVHPDAASGAAEVPVESEPNESVFAPTPEKIAPAPIVEPAITNGSAAKAERKPLSAAMLRRKRAYNRQPVEVVWKEPAMPSLMFVIASVIITIFAALILAAAFYLK